MPVIPIDSLPIGSFLAWRLRPEITPIFSESGKQVAVELDFDWMSGLSPRRVRCYRIERALNANDWESIGTVMLTNPPLRLIDPVGKKTQAVYRAVELPDFISATPLVDSQPVAPPIPQTFFPLPSFDSIIFSPGPISIELDPALFPTLLTPVSSE